VSIRDSLAQYDEAMDAFDESEYENGDHAVKDYEYRDDSAVDFANDAAEFIRSLLELADQIPEVEHMIEASREADTFDEVIDARDSADDLLARIHSLTKGAHS
jgi:hypothetical protein